MDHRRIILQVAISLDGYIEGPQGEFDWCFSDQDYGMGSFVQSIDTILMGRKTYDLMKNMPVNPDDPIMSSFAHIKQYVFSHSPCSEPLDEKTQWVTGDTIEWIRQYKGTPGKDIWLFGGALFTAALLQEGLLDEFQLAVHPILLGGGKPFIQHIAQRVPLKLIDVQTYDTGLVMMKYNISGEGK